MDVNTRGSLACALNARKSECIGVVVESFDYYKLGDFVFIDEDNDGTTWTVSKPMTQKELDEQRVSRSLLRDIGTIMFVPKKYVKRVL